MTVHARDVACAQLKEAPTLVPKPKVLQTSFPGQLAVLHEEQLSTTLTYIPATLNIRSLSASTLLIFLRYLRDFYTFPAPHTTRKRHPRSFLKKFEQHQNRASSPRLRGKPTYDAETLSTSQRTKTDKSFSMNEIANSFWDKDNTATVALFKGINEPGVVSAVAVHVPDTDVKGPAWGASGCQGAFSTLPTGRGQAGHGAPVQLTAIAAQLGTSHARNPCALLCTARVP